MHNKLLRIEFLKMGDINHKQVKGVYYYTEHNSLRLQS
jgi:hypothetical protein